MSGKRDYLNIDPDYEDVTDQQNKRQRVLEKDAKDATIKKIEDIVIRQFGIELDIKEDEVNIVDQRLNQARLMMDRLRACIVANYYGSTGQQKYGLGTSKQFAIHPAVKSHLGKTVTESQKSEDNHSITNENLTQDNNQNPLILDISNRVNEQEKIEIKPSTTHSEFRNSRFKIKKRIIVGNVAKYIPIDRRETNDQSTHKWMVYVRGPIDKPRIDDFVKKIWFFLHPSYRPNDLVEICKPPFHLTRRGWGEFPIRVQLHFTDGRNKKVDIIHNLKLDRTYTGLQTLGAETVVDVELEKDYSNDDNVQKLLINDKIDSTSNCKSDVSQTDVKSEVLGTGDDSNLDVNHTIIHSPVKSQQSPLQVSLNSNHEVTPKINLDSMGLPSSSQQPKSSESAAQTNKQTVYLRCKDAKGNILLVPKVVINKNNSSDSRSTVTNSSNQTLSYKLTSPSANQMTPFRLISTTSNPSTVCQIQPTETKSVSPISKNLQSNNPVSSCSQNVFVSPPRPSVKLMVTSKGLQALPQTQDTNNSHVLNVQQTSKSRSLLTTPRQSLNISTAYAQDNIKSHTLLTLSNLSSNIKTSQVPCTTNTQLSAKSQLNLNNKNQQAASTITTQSKSRSLLTIESASQSPRVPKVHSLLTLSKTSPSASLSLNSIGENSNPQMCKTQSLLTLSNSNHHSQKPVSLKLHSNSLKLSSIKDVESNKVTQMQPGNQLKFVLHNKEQNSLLNTNQNNQIISSCVNSKTPPKSPQLVLASVGSKTFLLQMQADGHNNQSQLSKQLHLKPTVNTMKILTNQKVDNISSVSNQKAAYKILTVKQQLHDKKVKSYGDMSTVNNIYDKELDKKTHVWKKSKLKIEEEDKIPQLRIDDYCDMISLIKAAVKRHPLVKDCVNRSVHPYCANTHQQWLNWNIGKRRASEWQRASWARKFICDQINGDVFKGKKLWSTKQIMYWCRLHAFSPHYLEEKLKNTVFVPTNESETNCRLVNSLTDVNQIINQLPQQLTSSDNKSEDEIDIINMSPPNIKVKLKEEPFNIFADPPIFLPPSEQALFIQDTCQKIGVNFRQTDLEENVFGASCEDMIYSAMKLFLEDILRDSFSIHQSKNSTNDDTICYEDVQQALIKSPTTDFITNAHLGVKTGDIFPTYR